MAQAALYLFLFPLLVLLLLRSVFRPSRRSSGGGNNLHGRLPPWAPGQLPIIGHFHLVGSHPHVSLRDIAAEHGAGGLVLLRLGQVPTLVVSSPSAAEAVLRAHDHAMASRPPSAVADILLSGASDVALE